MMQIRELAHHREPDAAAGDRRVAVTLQPPESVPYALAIGARDAGAAVGDPQPRHAILARCTDPHFLAGGAVLHGVVEQVEQHLAHRAGVGRDDEVFGHGCGQGDAAGRRQRRKAVDDFLHQRRQGGWLRRDMRCPPFRAREVQQVLDEVRQAARFLVDDRQGAAPLFFGTDAAERQGLGEHADLRERRAQLVRDAGDEVGPQLSELGFAPQLEQRSSDQCGGQSEQAQNQRQARLGQAADDQLVGDLGAQRGMGKQRAHVGADRVACRVWRGVLHGRPIDLDPIAVGDDDGSHRIVLHATRERPRQEGKLCRRRRLHEQRLERSWLRFEAEGGA